MTDNPAADASLEFIKALEELTRLVGVRIVLPAPYDPSKVKVKETIKLVVNNDDEDDGA